MNISYAITVKDEINEVKQLIGRLVTTLKSQDEIVVLWDDKGDIEIKKWIEEKIPFNVKLYPVTFNKDFSELKNTLNGLCEGDYIFQLDADEFPDERLLENLHNIIESNPECEAYWLPRENYVNGIGLSHVKQWNWNVIKSKNIEEKVFDLNNPQDLNEYNLLKQNNFIINEKVIQE